MWWDRLPVVSGNLPSLLNPEQDWDLYSYDEQINSDFYATLRVFILVFRIGRWAILNTSISLGNVFHLARLGAKVSPWDEQEHQPQPECGKSGEIDPTDRNGLGKASLAPCWIFFSKFYYFCKKCWKWPDSIEKGTKDIARPARSHVHNL